MSKPVFPEAVTLELPVAGTGEWRSCAARAHFIGGSRRAADPYGAALAESTVLLQGGTAPAPGARLLRNGEILELKTVRECRDLDGCLIAWRCTVE